MAQAILALPEKPAIPLVIRRHVYEKPKAEDYLRLAFSIAARFVKNGAKVKDSEEYSDALIGLVEAINKYEVPLSEFTTYATKVIERSIIDGYRKRTRRKRNLPVESDISPEVERAVVVPDNEEKIPVHLIEKFMSSHPDDTERDVKDREILRMKFLEGKSWAEIGRLKNISRCFAMQCGQRAISTIRARHKEAVIDE